MAPLVLEWPTTLPAGDVDLPGPAEGIDQIEVDLDRPRAGSLVLEVRRRSDYSERVLAIPAFPGADRYLATLSATVEAPATLRFPEEEVAESVTGVRLWPPAARERTRGGVTRTCRSAQSVRIEHVRLGGGFRVRVGVARFAAEGPPRGEGRLVASWSGAIRGERWQLPLAPEESWQDFWLSRDGNDETGDLVLRAELPERESACFMRPVPAPPPPTRVANVVLVSIDTLRADALGDAPALRARASTGKYFSRAYALSNWTLPSHAGMFLARGYLDHGLPLSGENAAFAYPEGRLSPAWTTLAEAFHEAGYATFASTEGGYLDPKFGFARGFEDYSVVPALTVDRSSHFESHLERLEKFVTTARGGRPFFVFLHTYRVHDYLLNTSEYQCALAGDDPAQRRRGDLSPLWVAAGAADPRAFASLPLAYARSLYRCGVADTDRLIEEAIRTIEMALGSRERLLVAYTSDHGESFGERERVIGHGTALDEEQIRVPLVFWANDGSVPATRVEEVTSAIDVAPTLLSWAKIPIPESFRGGGDLLGPGARLSPVEAMSAGLAGDFRERHLGWVRFDSGVRFERRDRADGATVRRRCESFGDGVSVVPTPPTRCEEAERLLTARLGSRVEWTWSARALRAGELVVRVDRARTALTAAVASAGSSQPLFEEATGLLRFSAQREGDTLLLFARGEELAVAALEWNGVQFPNAMWPTGPGAEATLSDAKGPALRVSRHSPPREGTQFVSSRDEVERLERELRALGYLR